MTTWSPQKRAVVGPAGMVAAQHWRAAQAGAQILSEGGNAIDAAVTTTLMLSVVEPWLSGIGGGGFMIRVDGVTGAAAALDFNMTGGSTLNPADYPIVSGQDDDWFNWPAVEGDRNISGWTSICVPGAVAGLAEALERFGTISWQRAIAPALAEAEHGLRVDWFTALCLAIDAQNLAQFPASAALFLEDGRAPRLPERVAEIARPWPAMAETLRRLRDEGPRDFYEGETARLLLSDLAEGGAPVTADDLKAYRPSWHEPLTCDYRDTRILAMPGLSGGPALADTLASISREISGPCATVEPTHAVAYANAIRAAYHRRLTRQGHSAPGCTSHVSVVDANGTMVSLTNTLLSRFGAKVVSARTGMLLNNGVMWFDPRPGTPNAITPGTQPLANMCPVVALKDGKPWLALGAAGGRQIFPAVAQILSYLIDHRMGLETALHTPRIDASTPVIFVNRMARPDIAAAIAEHHPVEVVDDALYPVRFAIPSAVMREHGRSIGMAHPNHPWAAAARAAS